MVLHLDMTILRFRELLKDMSFYRVRVPLKDMYFLLVTVLLLDLDSHLVTVLHPAMGLLSVMGLLPVMVLHLDKDIIQIILDQDMVQFQYINLTKTMSKIELIIQSESRLPVQALILCSHLTVLKRIISKYRDQDTVLYHQMDLRPPLMLRRGRCQ